jgi:hypothetical protein
MLKDVDSVRVFVRSIYAQYAQDKPEPTLLTDRAGQFFTPSLLAQIRQDQKNTKDGQVGILDHDPICGCQDYSDLRIIEPILVKPGKNVAFVQVTLKNLGKISVITYRMVFDGGHWLIDDISEDGILSLQAFLKQGLVRDGKNKFGSL